MNGELKVELGTRVEVELMSKTGARERLPLDIVPDQNADFDRGLLGAGTPLARSIIGHAAGETLDYKRGEIVTVTIHAVHPSDKIADLNVSGQREEVMRRARDKAELANMVSFALTFDSKWGDYDPEEISKNWEQEHKEEDGSPQKDKP